MMVLALLVGAGSVYLWSSSNGSLGRPTVESTQTVTTTVYPSGGEILLMTINGVQYYADDVSNDMVFQNPGYSYLRNGSVTFMGVTFETNCPQGYSGCPQPPGSANQTRTVLGAGVISFNMTWQQDKSSETAGGMIGDSTYVYFLSKRTGPSAGILIEYVPPDRAFLLVQNLY